MQDLTRYLLSYRECARTVWNQYLKDYADGERDFTIIERNLFSAMLETQIATYKSPGSLNGLEYYSTLRVLPRNPSQDVDVLYASEEVDTVVWQNRTWRSQLGELCYRSLFDFETYSGHFREFRYVDCIVVSSKDSDVQVGQRILIEAAGIKVFDVSLPESS